MAGYLKAKDSYVKGKVLALMALKINQRVMA